ncbi:MAG: diaminopimelate decarboxylase [Chlorobi bacterium]|nr:diaminopimelate decarboxylase [Chlorobiota bacterium]
MSKKYYERPVIIKQHSGMMNKFGSSPSLPPITEVEGIPVKELTEKYGSPLFTFSERKIRDNQRKMLRIFKTRYPKVQFAWSYKTNYLGAICSVFHQEGSWAEVVSEFEYDKAKGLGVDGQHIIFNGPDKTEEALEKAVKDKAKIHIDHFDELYSLMEITERLNLKADVAIRVNMDTGIYPKWDRFGFNYENGEAAQALKRIAMNDNLNLIGLHTHIGTYIMSAEPYRQAVIVLVELANMLSKQYDIALDYIDVGGGLPSNNTLKGQYLDAEQILPTYEQYADAITAPLFDLNLKPDELPTLILESGRALIDDAGYLLSTVIGNKRLSNGKRTIIIDAGVNYLFTSHWFNHKIAPAQHSGSFTENSAVYGPLCMNIDVLREDIVLPTMRKGDQVVILYVGAYSVTQWMQFITLRPNVVMIMEDGSVEVIRESEKLENITSSEKVPEKLNSFSLK